eukprot:scpid64997/ scgid24259/ 
MAVSKSVLDIALLTWSACRQIVSDICACKICRTGSLTVKETDRAGLASCISLVCSNVDCAGMSKYPLIPKSNQYFYDCNKRSVLAARSIGKGHRGLRKFCGIMNLPPPISKSAFQCHQKALYVASKSVAESSMQQASRDVQALNLSKQKDEHITEVTFDGTWMKRGFTSLHGVFTCIGWEVGRVLDLHISTKHCHACKQWMEKRERDKITAAEYQTQTCQINTDRSAPGMEAEVAVTLCAERKLKEAMKSRRRQRRRRRKGIEEQNLEEEGTTYAAGEF